LPQTLPFPFEGGEEELDEQSEETKGARMELVKIACAKPTLANAQMTILEAVKLMATVETDAIIITDAEKKVQGIFTERDNLTRITLRELDPRTTTLAKAMTAPVVTVTMSATVDEALGLLFRNRFRHLPVVDAEHRAVGIVSARDLLMRRIGEKEAALQTLQAYVTAGGPG
jgi:CBS domain-containing protein